MVSPRRGQRGCWPAEQAGQRYIARAEAVHGTQLTRTGGACFYQRHQTSHVGCDSVNLGPECVEAGAIGFELPRYAIDLGSIQRNCVCKQLMALLYALVHQCVMGHVKSIFTGKQMSFCISLELLQAEWLHMPHRVVGVRLHEEGSVLNQDVAELIHEFVETQRSNTAVICSFQTSGLSSGSCSRSSFQTPLLGKK
eukprot:2275691-Rhodomonas_salina.1